MEPIKTPVMLYTELGQSLFYSGRYNESIEILKKALAEPDATNHSQVYLTLGKAYKMTNQPAQALNAFVNAVSLDSNTFQEVEQEIASFGPITIPDKGVTSESPLARVRGKVSSLFSSASNALLRSMRDLVDRGTIQDMVKQGKYSEAEVLLRFVTSAWPDDIDLLEQYGHVLLAQGKLPLSMEVFQRVVDRDPRRTGALRGLGDIYVKEHMYERAIDTFNRALAVDEADVSSLIGRAIAYKSAGRLDDSERDLRRAIRIDSKRPILYQELASIQHSRGNESGALRTLLQGAQACIDQSAYSDARNLASLAIQLSPESAEAYSLMGFISRKLGRLDEARESYEKAISLKATAQNYYELAQLYSDLSNLPNTVEAVDRALAMKPGWAEALVLKASALRKMGENDQALDILDEVIEENDELAEAHVERGAALVALDEEEEAIAAFERALELEPDQQYALAQLGALLYNSGEYEEALIHLDAAINLKPEEWIYRTKGLALYALERYKEAISAFDESLLLDSANSEANFYRGISLRLLERYEEAVSAIQLAIDLYLAEGKTEIPEQYAELGEALRMLARDREAKRAFEKAMSMRENYAWAMARYGETLRTLSLNEPDENRKKSQLMKAIDFLQRAAEISSYDAWTWASLGAAHADAEHLRSALEAIEKALEFSPDYHWAWAYKGIVLRLAARFPASVAAFDRAIELNLNSTWVLAEKGVALRLQGKEFYPQAAAVLEESIRMQLDHTWAIFQLAICYYLMGRFEDALLRADEVRSMDSSQLGANQVRSLALKGLGRQEEAQKAHEDALTPAKDVNAHLNRGSIYILLDAHDLAEADFHTAAQIAEQQAEQSKTWKVDLANSYNALAWMLVDDLNVRLEEAVELAQKGIALLEDTTDLIAKGNILDTLGWAYYKLGRYEEAKPLFEEATKLKPEDLIIADHIALLSETPAATTSLETTG